MPEASPLLVTGIAGNLGVRLLRQLEGVPVIGVDLTPPSLPIWRFERLDLAQESSCDALSQILRQTGANAVAHLAFVIDPVRTGVLDVRRMWQINVAGTARVMEAIAVVNRTGGSVRKFIFPSSVSAYGSDLATPADENSPLEGHTLPYAIHKRVADEVVQLRAEQLGDCRAYILRPHIFAGATMQNYLIGALRGIPTGHGGWAEKLRQRGTRLPIVLPRGEGYLKNKFQFVHVDDMSRLVAFIIREAPADSGITILNVAAPGDPVSFEECARIADAKLLRLPTRLLCRAVLRVMWALGISGVPPEALPYIAGSYTMRTERLQQFLGSRYRDIMCYDVRRALADSFTKAEAGPVAAPVTAASAR
jgi:nucleoside-diphosphate-sugar epimerase